MNDKDENNDDSLAVLMKRSGRLKAALVDELMMAREHHPQIKAATGCAQFVPLSTLMHVLLDARLEELTMLHRLLSMPPPPPVPPKEASAGYVAPPLLSSDWLHKLPPMDIPIGGGGGGGDKDHAYYREPPRAPRPPVRYISVFDIQDRLPELRVKCLAYFDRCTYSQQRMFAAFLSEQRSKFPEALARADAEDILVILSHAEAAFRETVMPSGRRPQDVDARDDAAAESGDDDDPRDFFDMPELVDVEEEAPSKGLAQSFEHNFAPPTPPHIDANKSDCSATASTGEERDTMPDDQHETARIVHGVMWGCCSRAGCGCRKADSMQPKVIYFVEVSAPGRIPRYLWIPDHMDLAGK